jgi:hypothetical protein
MLQMKITKIVSVMYALCGQPCERNRVTGLSSRVPRCDAVPFVVGGGAHAVAQLGEALRYKPEGRGVDSRWCHWNFSKT